MTRSFSLVPALAVMSLLGAWVASCSDDTSRVCTPGSTRICADVGRCEGAQSCLPDGSGYGACDCSGPPRQGNGGDSQGEPLLSVVGRQCSEDAQCGEGLQCFASGSNQFFGGGPANGYCSTQCGSNQDCTAIDSSAQCSGGLCIRTCFSLDPTLDENKCLGRHDVGCQSAAFAGEPFTGSRQIGLCLPQCGSDEDCDGRFCDLARGLCTGNRPTGAAVGEPCESDEDCAGRACSSGGGLSVCTAPCVFGQPVGCGDGISANPRNFGCWAPVVSGFTASEGIGDMGFCVELCDVDADCAQNLTSGWVCNTEARVTVRGQSVGAERFGRSGRCLPPVPGDAGADGGDASSDSGAVASDAGDASAD